MLTVVDAQGRAIPEADVTIATFRKPFALSHSTVLTTYRTNDAGVLELRQKRKWQMQLMLPDGFGWYTWLYCVEEPGYRALASTEIEDRIGPTTIVMQSSQGSASKCAWPGPDEPYSQVGVTDGGAPL